MDVFEMIKGNRGLIARASITINALGLEGGSSIVWKGEWQGKKYEDRGVILRLEPGHMIQYSHFSPLSGQPDLPENYHIVTIELSGKGRQTLVSLLQDNNATEKARKHSENNWKMMLGGLKKILEK